MTVAEMLDRGKSATGKATRYRFGAGGLDPTTPGPGNLNGECDSAGFICWCLRQSRRTDHPLYKRLNGGWLNTDSMFYDVRHQTGYFRRLERPQPGALVLFPSKFPQRETGHIGIITGVTPKGNQITSVLHCSPGNWKDTGDAIGETLATVFSVADVTYGWFEGLS